MAVKTETRRRIWPKIAAALGLLAVLVWYFLSAPWGFYWAVPEEEAALRTRVVAAAQNYLGFNEADGSHRQIVDGYNAHEPLAQDYAVTYEDSWCAAFVSLAAIEAGVTDIIPTECSCQRQTLLFQDLGRWEERDDAVPLPGDLIYYDWDSRTLGDCTGWPDHVGIVVGTKWPFIKVIEGNRDDRVCYRYVLMGDYRIRGFGQPDYASLIDTESQ